MTITTESVLTKKQVKTSGPRPITFGGDPCTLTAEVRFDDECGNGHNTFAITGTIRYCDKRRARRDNGWAAGGCLHEEIAAKFPELAPFIKWHLSSTDGPMHYPGNALYHAGDRDCNGRAAGEPSSWDYVVEFEGCPIKWRTRDYAFMKWLRSAEGSDFEVIRIDHEKRAGETYEFGPKYTLGGAPDRWHECPFDTEEEALEFLAAMRLGWKVLSVPTAWSKGKARDLAAARSCAVWPDATDEELTAPGLKERLEARLPALMAEFRAAVESLGFVW